MGGNYTEQDNTRFHQSIIFGHEAFLLGLLQTLAAGAIVASIANVDSVMALVGPLVFKLFITLMTITLCSSLIAVFGRWQYKSHDLKQSGCTDAGAEKSRKKAGFFNKLYMACIWVAVICAVLSLAGMVMALYL